jgi:hypothetical protein
MDHPLNHLSLAINVDTSPYGFSFGFKQFILTHRQLRGKIIGCSSPVRSSVSGLTI